MTPDQIVEAFRSLSDEDKESVFWRLAELTPVTASKLDVSVSSIIGGLYGQTVKE